jgi:glycosyltransferase involved in cell wall biosynthesis
VTTSFTIVVPTHRRPQALGATLDALLAIEHDAFDVIVVDDGSGDETPEVVAAAGARYARQDSSGAAAARNHGARLADGEYIVFVDDDILVRPDHLARHAAVHARNERALVNGEWEFTPEVISLLQTSPFGRYRLALEEEFRRATPGQPLADGCIALEAIPSQDLSLRRELFHEIGGFDESFPAAGAEDRELSYRAVAAGCVLLRDPSIRLLHNDARVSLEQFCRREERNAGTFVVLARRHPDDPIARSYLDANGPGASPRKLVKAAVSRTAPLAAMLRLAAVLERVRAPELVLRRCYSLLAGLHIFRGVRSVRPQR